MYNPFRADFRVVVPGVTVPRIDVGGIFVLATTGKASTPDTTLDYGINPCQWQALPNEGVMIWKVRHPADTSETGLPVTVVVPSLGASTVTSSNTVSGTSKVPVVDNKGAQVAGSDVTDIANGYTEHWVYFNKNAGIFRLLGVEAQAAPAPTAASAKSTASSK